MIPIAISFYDRGGKRRKIFGITAFPSYRNALFDIENAIHKGQLCSLAEKGRGLDPLVMYMKV